MTNLIEYAMFDRTEQFVYKFGDVVMTCNRSEGGISTVWYIECDGCHKNRRFKKFGSKMWVAKCHDCKLEYTITPSELYTKQLIDFSSIIGDIVI